MNTVFQKKFAACWVRHHSSYNLDLAAVLNEKFLCLKPFVLKLFSTPASLTASIVFNQMLGFGKTADKITFVWGCRQNYSVLEV